MKIGIINGVNLNLLGLREPHIYGTQVFDDFFTRLRAEFSDTELHYAQHNEESKFIEQIQQWGRELDGLIVNPGAWSHQSLAIADALRSSAIPVIEVHISAVHQREVYRQTLITGAACKGVISGLGLQGYRVAIWHLINM